MINTANLFRLLVQGHLEPSEASAKSYFQVQLDVCCFCFFLFLFAESKTSRLTDHKVIRIGSNNFDSRLLRVVVNNVTLISTPNC